MKGGVRTRLVFAEEKKSKWSAPEEGAAGVVGLFPPETAGGSDQGETPRRFRRKNAKEEKAGETWRHTMNVYELVTSKIIERLEEGVIPWRKCWTSGPAKSLTTGKEYRGINSVLLGMREYSSRYWVTFRQAQKLGGNVKKGEKATPVVYWHWRTPDEMAKLQADGKAAAPAPCYPFLAFVFNLDQTEGVERPADDVPARPNSPLEEAQRIVAEMPKRPGIRHGATFNPCYNVAHDVVAMPNLGQFEDAEHYFCALHHELFTARGAQVPPEPLREKRWGEP